MFATLAVTLGSSLAPAEAQGAQHRIEGTLTNTGGVPLGGHQIAVAGQGASQGQTGRGVTAADGTFAIEVPDGTYGLYLATARDNDCTLAGYDNPESDWTALIAVNGQSITGLEVTVSGTPGTAPVFIPCTFPDEALGHIQGIVTDAEGEPVERVWITANVHGDSGGVYEGEWTASDGTFHLRLRHGVYLLHIHSERSDECTVSGYEGPGARGLAFFDTRDGDVAGLHVTVSGATSPSPVWAICQFDAPLPRIGGTVRGPDGDPLDGISVRAFGELGTGTFGPWASPDTGPHGTFSIEVPDGSYAVQLYRTIGGVECSLGYADDEIGHTFFRYQVNLISTSGGSATGITVSLSDTPSALCKPITGTMTGSDGELLGRVSMAADGLGPLVGVRANWASNADGTFTLYAQPGSYHVLLATTEGSKCTLVPSADPEAGARARVEVTENGVGDLRIVVSGEPSDSLQRFYCSVPPRMVTTELQPGWNLAGWTSDEVDATALFGEIPGLEAAHAWDAEAGRFLSAFPGAPDDVNSLDVLAPGMGLWLYVSGTEPVGWTRPLLPESGFVLLKDGWNLVAWSGEDRVTVDRALAALGSQLRAAAAWDAGTGQALNYAPAEAPSGNTLERLSRGGALWVEVSEDRPWLQPEAPFEVEFGEDYSEDRRDELRALVDTAVAFYAHNFGIFVPGITVRYRDDHERNCFYSNRTIFLKERCWTAIGHEYGHAVQEHLAGGGSSPGWIIEGTANRWSAQFHEARGFRTYADHLRDTVHPQARRTLTPLEDLEASLSEGGLTQNYNLIHVAIDYLVELVGEDRTFEYFRERANYRTWQDAFHGTFGLSVDDFYTEFAEYRKASFAPFPAIRGLAVTPEGSPVQRLWLGAFPLGESGYLGASTAADGTFTLRVPEGAYHLQFHTDTATGCTVSGYEGAVTGRHAIVRVGAEGVSGIQIVASGPPSDEAVWSRCTFAE